MFNLKENNTTPVTEILGGIITFFAMIYILPVNSSILSDMGMSVQGVFASTALVSGLVTILMGLYAKYPMALSAGMGLNAFIVYTVSLTFGYSWQESLILLTISGIVFFVMSFTPVRKAIINAFPKELQLVISASLGGFICLIGLKGARIIAASPATLVTLGSLNSPSVILALLGIVLVLYISTSTGRTSGISQFAIPIGMCAIAVLGILGYYIGFEKCGIEWFRELPHFSGKWGAAGLKDVLFFGAFSENTEINKNFSGMLFSVLTKPVSYVAIFSLIFVNLFDTTATLMAVRKEIGGENEIDISRAIMVDSTGALVCAPLGTSTVTSFAESTVGVNFGARTGLASVFTGLCFLLAMFIFPVFSVFTNYAVTCPALACVGAIIFINNVRDMKWDDAAVNFAMMFTIVLVMFTYSLTNGIGLGLLVYLVIRIAQRRAREVNPILFAVCIFFIASIVANSLI